MEMNEDKVLTVTITVSEYEQLVRDSECLRVVQSMISDRDNLMINTDVIMRICGT